MKKSIIKYLSIATLCSASLMGCNKQFLNTIPISFNSEVNFYKTESDFDKAIAGVYNKLLAFPDVNNIYLSEVRSSNFYIPRQSAQRDYFNISGFEVTSQLATLTTAWANDYALIDRANELLEKIKPFTYVDSTKKNRIIGEARMLRGYAYSELVKAFGAVPLIDHTVSSTAAFSYPRVGIDTVYNFIVNDLVFASTALPASYTGADIGRATKYAALGMLGRVYMFMAGYPMNKPENFANAKTVLKQVLDAENTGWKFATNYSDLFKAANDNKYNVFEVQYVSGGLGLGNLVPGEGVPLDVDKNIMPYGYYYIAGSDFASDDLIASFEPGDKREFVTLDTLYRNTAHNYVKQKWFKKFLDSTSVTGMTSSSDWPINFPLLRGEDVMLMYCEAINETANGATTEATTIVNRIRTRAGLTGITAAATANHDAFKLALEHERRSEFAWEGLYWWDLVRTGRCLSVMNPWLTINYQKTIDATQFIYPIPYSEIVVKPGLYYQNPGY